MNPITRRSVMAGSAAAVTALPALALPVAAREGGELAALVRRYYEECDQCSKMTKGMGDEAYEALAKVTWKRTLDEMRNVPVRTQADALALMEFMKREDCVELWGPMDALMESLRLYIEGRTA